MHYAIEPLMPDRLKVKFQTKRNTRVYAVRDSSRFASETPSVLQTCLCKRTSEGVTPEEDPTSLKKAKLESATCEGAT